MAKERTPISGTQRARRLDKLGCPNGQNDAPDRAGVDHPTGDAEHDDQIAEVGPHHPDKRDGQQDGWDGELNVGQPHNDLVDLAAVIAADKPEQKAHRAGKSDGGHTHEQRNPRAKNDPREDIPA